MYISEIISRRNQLKDPGYDTFSLKEAIGNIKFPVDNILYDYLDILDKYCVTIVTNAQEQRKYNYNPDILSYDLYKTNQLDYFLMMLNGIIDKKDFICTKIKVILPEYVSVLGEIYAKEKKYIKSVNEVGKLSRFSIGRLDNKVNSKPITVDKKKAEADRKLKQLQADLMKLRNDIYDSLKGLISDKTDKIISDQVLERLKDIQGKVDSLDRSSFEDLIKQKEQGILNIINNNTHKVEQIINRITNISENKDDFSDRLKDINKRVDQLQSLITNLDIRGLITDDLDAIRRAMDLMKKDIEKLANNESLINDINEIKEKMKKYEDDIKNVESKVTRDVVFQILSPVMEGPQPETELFLPYDGKIAQLIFSIDTETVPKSNFIQTLQIFDISVKDWVTAGRFNLYINNMYRIYDVNIPINNQYIRFTLSDGKYDYIKGGITIVARIKENRGLVLNENITEPELRKEEFTKNYHNISDL